MHNMGGIGIFHAGLVHNALYVRRVIAHARYGDEPGFLDNELSGAFFLEDPPTTGEQVRIIV